MMILLHFGKNNNYQLVKKKRRNYTELYTGVNISKVSSYVTQSILKHVISLCSHAFLKSRHSNRHQNVKRT